MGGMVDVGLGVDTKNSPRRAAIERAQAELRQEYYVREERKRELEFLEKGGNPLDFKVGSTSSISVQSTSVTDLPLDYDAKGSSAVATSPHGDSEDSCIRPGTILARDSNTADNISLMDGRKSTHDGNKNEIRPGKRKTLSSPEHPSEKVASNVRESDESVSFRFGVKSQAYARRNRSRPTREGVSVASARSTAPSSANKSSLFPSPSIDNGDKKDPSLEKQGEGNATSLASDTRPGSLNGNDVSRALDKGKSDQAEIVAGKQTPDVDTEKGEVEDMVWNHLQQKGSGDHSSRAAEGHSPPPSDSSVRESASARTALEPSLPDENIDKSGSVSSNTVGCQNDNQTGKHLDGQTVDEALASIDVGRNSSNPNADRVSSVEAQHSAFAAEDESTMEKRDLETVEVNPVDGCDHRIVDAEQVNSDLQGRNEETNDAKFSLGDEQQESILNKEKESESPLCSANDLQVISKLSGLDTINNSSAATYDPEKRFSEKAREDAVLKEAQIIEAKMRRANELSLCSFPLEKHQKSHWDYLLEEMAWLANDFMQERSWKITAAWQISHQVASAACRGWGNSEKQRKCAHSLAKGVASFWELAEALYTSRKSIDDIDKELKATLFVSMKNRKLEAVAHKQDEEHDEPPTKVAQVPILGYAVRFLGCNHISDHPVIIAEAPVTPERNCDSGALGTPWDDQSSEESLFYVIPAGAMKVYIEFIESRWLPHENPSTTMLREDFEVSTCDSFAEYGLHENIFDEDEAETATHYFSGAFERNKQLKFSHKKKRFFQDKNHIARSFEGHADFSYGPPLESKFSNQLTGKRVSGTFNVSSIPTKRMRTASRQRVVSPFGVGNSSLPVNSKTDASSGDTSSFQDDRASLHGESMSRKNADIESTADFEKKLLFDGSNISVRSKKKKKQRHMGFRNLNSPSGFVISKASLYDHRWQIEPTGQNDQKDHLKKRLDTHHFDSFGSSAVHGQHALKKPKMLKQLPDASPERINLASGSHASPAASQISSMPNTNKLIKLITSRDRNRKSKGLKMIGGQLGTGGSWSQFEDQALVVLVHDMGTNWELVSDTINSTLHFKCIYRKPNECKERHKILMERSAGDGADSAEDSGSSQSYPSTLPGIPKGSARQLFQRLQGPMEEDTLKSHFEKIILIGRQLHFRQNQAKSESKETKLMTQIHSSHIHALTQACPSILTGSPRTPLDLAEVTQSSEAPSHGGYQGSHPTTSPISTITASSSVNAMVPGPAAHGSSNSLSSPSAPQIGTPRYGTSRPSFPGDEQQQRMQPYGQMLSGRNALQQPSGTLTIGVDRGVRMLSGGNAMGMMCGVNNGMPVSARPGFQGIGSPGMVNVVTSGSMLPGSPVNSHSNAVSGQGSSLLRPRDHLQQMQRPPQNAEDHKQMMMQDVQLQPPLPVNPMGSMSGAFPGSQGSGSPGQVAAMPAFSSPQPPHLFSGNTHHPPHQMPSQQQAYAMRFAKERQQLQQRLLHQPPQPQPHQPSPGSPAHLNRPQSNPRTPGSSGGGGMLNQRQRQHPQHHPQTMPPRHLHHPQQQRLQNERAMLQQGQGGGLFSGGGAAAGQQKMYPRPPPPSRPLGPSAPPHQEAPAQGPLPLHSNQQQQRQQPLHSSQQTMQRILLQQNNHHAAPADGPPAAAPPVDLAPVNSTAGTGSDFVSVACSASTSPASGLGPHWKPEQAHTASPQKNTAPVGPEAAVLSSGQGMTKRPFSGLAGNVQHSVGSQWQQQKQAQQQQPPQDQSQPPPPPPLPPSNQYRQPGQSGSFGAPSNPKPV